MTKREKIKVLLECTQNSEFIEKGFKGLIESMPDGLIPGMADVKKAFLAKFQAMYESVLDEKIALFDSLLSDAAIDASIAFYSTEVGQEVIKAMPKIDEGLMELGSKLTGSLTKELINELLKLELTEEQMSSMGFIKIEAPDFANLFGNPDNGEIFDTDEEVPKKKEIPIDVADGITMEDFEKFAKEWLPKEGA